MEPVLPNEKKIYLLHDNRDWMEPIFDALEKRGAAYEEWLLDDHWILRLEEDPPEGVFLNRLSASSHTRNRESAGRVATQLTEWLENDGRRVLNGSRVIPFELNKMKQYRTLRRFGMKVPKTTAVFKKENALKAAREFSLPFLLKHNRGGSGSGIQLFQSHEALERYLSSDEYEPPFDGVLLIQEFIEAEEPFIVRMEFIDRKFVYAVKVDASQGFNLCPADSCRVDKEFCPVGEGGEEKFAILPDFTHPFIPKCEALLTDCGIDVAGIELIQAKEGTTYVYDLNTNTNYNQQAESRAGVSAYDRLADFLLRELQ